MYRLITAILVSVFLLIGCSENSSPATDIDYNSMKKMVTDILETADGKKALLSALNEDQIKQALIIDSDVVKSTLQEILASEEGAKMWENLFKDAEFAKTFAQSIASEQKKLLESVMSDSSFQEQLLGILQDPEVTKQMITAMKSQEFRSHLEETIQQAIDSPLFQSKMTEALLRAAEKQQEQQENDGAEEGKEQDSGGE